MHPSSWLTTPAATHRNDELARARTLTAGLPTAYQAYALAKQEQMRQIAIDLACDRLTAPAQNPPRRHVLRQALAVLSSWLPRRRPLLGGTSPARRSVIQ